jgi:acyl-CoA synthetase (AMP-forming)/AMP-acid ligase II
MYPGPWTERDPDRPAVIMAGSGARLTYAELDGRANRLAHVLHGRGLRRGDHVSFFMENRPELVVAFCAAERAGLCYTPIDAKYSPDEVSWIVNDSTSRVVIASAELADVARSLPATCPAVEHWLMVGGETAAPFADLGEAMAIEPSGPIDDERLGAAMLYSSGTTGRPKGVLRPVADVAPGDLLPAVEFARQTYRVTDGCTFVVPGPLHHAMGVMPIGTTLRSGGTAIILERFDAQQVVEVVEEHRATHLILVPTMAGRIVKLPPQTRSDHPMDTLEAVTLSGSPCPPSVKQDLISWVGPIVSDIYGGSEGAGLCVCDSYEALARPGTVGRAVVGELVILDEDDQPLGPHRTGRVYFRGGTPFSYFHDDDKTAEAYDRTGELATMGDIGYVDEDGYLFLTDRVAFTIVSGGVNIYPQEIENVLVGHPLVEDVAVIGVPDDDRGEQVKAIVQLTSGAQPSPELATELIASTAERLARYKQPRSVDFVDEIPRNSAGKIDKRALKASYWAASPGVTV